MWCIHVLCTERAKSKKDVLGRSKRDEIRCQTPSGIQIQGVEPTIEYRWGTDLVNILSSPTHFGWSRTTVMHSEVF